MKTVDIEQSRPPLVDRYGRSIDYLRLSFMDKCNLRCFYCLPKGFKDFETPENGLSCAEIARVVATGYR